MRYLPALRLLEMQLTDVYLDNAAATRPCKQALEAFNEAIELFANPSSGHAPGAGARELMERSRAIIAETVNAAPEEIIFTSGGTESNALALNGRRHVTASILEHSSVRENADELVSVGELAAKPREGLVSCVYVCGENGAVQPIADIAREVKKHGALFHADAVQAFGRIDCDVRKSGVDFMSFSAHKIRGIRGAGALYVRKGANVKPLWRGGGQEGGLRAGTEALPLIAAFAAAARTPAPDTRPLLDFTLEMLREKLPGVIPVPPHEAPHILSLELPGCPGQVMVRLLSDMGVYVSTGSACARGKTSPILKALNFKNADSVIRVSFGGMNTRADAERLIDALALALKRLQ